jgi:hypothetical protein
VQVLGTFTVSVALGLALGFLFGVGCAAAVLYSVFLAGYRSALRDAAAGGTQARYREQSKKLKRS